MLGEEREHLEAAARQVLEAVDPEGDASATGSTLVERLREASQKLISTVTDTTLEYISHTLGLFKSFWTEAQLEVLADGKAEDCSEEQFLKYRLSVFNRLPTEGYTQGGKFWVRIRRDQELEGARNTRLLDRFRPHGA
jgi:hypothetical protein